MSPDRLLTDAERDRLLLAVARHAVAHHTLRSLPQAGHFLEIGKAQTRFHEALRELRGALQSIEEREKPA